jgi:hypothetical protein
MSQDPNDFRPSNQPRSNRGAYYLAGITSTFAILGIAFAGVTIYRSSQQQPASDIASFTELSTATATPSAATPTDTASPPPTASAPAPSPVTAPSATPAPVTPTVSTGSYQTQGTQDGTPFTVRVLELKRASGNSVLLRLAVTNTGRQNIQFSFLNVTPNESIYIVDAQEQKKAYPLEDANGKAVATDGLSLSSLEPEQTVEVFAQFPAPAPTTQQLSIYFPGTSSPIADVPIAQ